MWIWIGERIRWSKNPLTLMKVSLNINKTLYFFSLYLLFSIFNWLNLTFSARNNHVIIILLSWQHILNKKMKKSWCFSDLSFSLHGKNVSTFEEIQKKKRKQREKSHFIRMKISSYFWRYVRDSRMGVRTERKEA